MDSFLKRFFPHVAAQEEAGSSSGGDAYCTYSDVGLQLFTSSLFLAAAFAGLAGSFTTRCSPPSLIVAAAPHACLIIACFPQIS